MKNSFSTQINSIHEEIQNFNNKNYDRFIFPFKKSRQPSGFHLICHFKVRNMIHLRGLRTKKPNKVHMSEIIFGHRRQKCQPHGKKKSSSPQKVQIIQTPTRSRFQDPKADNLHMSEKT